MCPSRFPRSRRSVLQAFGGSVCVLTGGCLGLDQLQRSATNSHSRSVTESNPEHTEKSFMRYVKRMRTRYGNNGVWGINRKNGNGTGSTETEKLSFVGAWSDEWTLRKPQTPTDGRQLRIPVDYAVVLYRVHGRTDEQGRPVHRLWLWAASRPKQSDEGYGRTALIELSVGISLDGSGVLDQYAPGASVGSNSAPVRIGLSGPSPREPSALLPIATGRIQPSSYTAVGSNGGFAVGWAGAYGSTISVVGVCEVRCAPERNYEFTMTSEASGTQGTL
jgi:hypothetical protein